MKRVVLPLLLGAALMTAAARSALTTPALTTPAPPAPAAPTRAAEVPVPVLQPEPLRFAHPLGDAFLFTPAACEPGCALVVVSHSRGMTAELSLSRPHLLGIYRRLQAAGYGVLVSNDAGPTTWGAPQALTYLADMHSRATRAFPFNGRTYNFGYSMGGLPALLTASRGVYPVSGVILLDAQVSLQDVWRSGSGNPTFVADIAAAHGLTRGEALPPERDPWTSARSTWAALPLLVAGGAGDTVVSFARNGEALFAQTSAQGSQLLRLEGPHLGGSHFGDALLEPMLAFLGRLESAQARAPKPLVPVPDPAAPAPAPTDATE